MEFALAYFCNRFLYKSYSYWKWSVEVGGDLGQLRQFLLKKAAAWNLIRTWSWGPFMKAIIFRVVLNLKGRELNCWTEAGEYLMLLLDLKTHLTPSWNSLNCQSGLSKVFFTWLSLFWVGGENNIVPWFSFHFQVGAAVKPGVFIARDQALPKLQQTLLLLITGTGPVYTTWDIFG